MKYASFSTAYLDENLSTSLVRDFARGVNGIVEAEICQEFPDISLIQPRPFNQLKTKLDCQTWQRTFTIEFRNVRQHWALILSLNLIHKVSVQNKIKNNSSIYTPVANPINNLHSQVTTLEAYWLENCLYYESRVVIY